MHCEYLLSLIICKKKKINIHVHNNCTWCYFNNLVSLPFSVKL